MGGRVWVNSPRREVTSGPEEIAWPVILASSAFIIASKIPVSLSVVYLCYDVNITSFV